MLRILTAFAFVLLMLPGLAHAQSEQQQLVDRSALALQDLMGDGDPFGAMGMLRKARAVMVCPRVFKAGFFFGGEGGSCVLAARGGGGSWSYPAFYAIGSGSFGLQIGIQDAQFIMMILTDKGLSAVMDNQFKIGGDASIAVATLGAGVQGDTTAGLGADIVAFTLARGLYGGISVQGSVLAPRTEWNQAYYGQPMAARQIVMEMQANNAGADPLRQVLTRYGNAAEATQAAAITTSPPPPSGAYPAAPGMAVPPPPPGHPMQLSPPPGSGAIQQQTLAPPKS
jgi:lipid-binding SYLF domain-containing protein